MTKESSITGDDWKRSLAAARVRRKGTNKRIFINMISQPLKLTDGKMVPCEPSDATHLKFVVPGPVGQLCLPVMIGGTRAGTNNWTWNGSVDAPTLRPSVLTWNEREGLRCHSWINDGHAQFLDDTTHDLRGKTVPLREIVCDHEWEPVDDSFDHEYGTERIVFERCELCGATREHEPYDGPEGDM